MYGPEIPGFKRGQFEKIPHKNSEIEEERRIGFVGLSRAMRLLYLSYSHDYLEDTNRRSTFLDEIEIN
jgi:superfamily I DNA/RNA helicase